MPYNVPEELRIFPSLDMSNPKKQPKSLESTNEPSVDGKKMAQSKPSKPHQDKGATTSNLMSPKLATTTEMSSSMPELAVHSPDRHAISSRGRCKKPRLFSRQYLLLIGGASLMATIEQSPEGATFAQTALSVLIDANVGD
jgi:hypothetical protein